MQADPDLVGESLLRLEAGAGGWPLLGAGAETGQEPGSFVLDLHLVSPAPRPLNSTNARSPPEGIDRIIGYSRSPGVQTVSRVAEGAAPVSHGGVARAGKAE